MAAASVTAVLVLGSAASAQAALAAPAPKSHIKFSLTDKGLRACAEKHDVLGAYLEFGGWYAVEHFTEELFGHFVPGVGEALFARDAAKFGTAFFTFYYDCVVPYVRPDTIEPAPGLVLPGFTVGPPSPQPPSRQQQPSSPPPTPGDSGVPFYTLGGSDG